MGEMSDEAARLIGSGALVWEDALEREWTWDARGWVCLTDDRLSHTGYGPNGAYPDSDHGPFVLLTVGVSVAALAPGPRRVVTLGGDRFQLLCSGAWLDFRARVEFCTLSGTLQPYFMCYADWQVVGG